MILQFMYIWHIQRNHSCDIAPKNAAAFDLTFDRFCWVADCVICDEDDDAVAAVPLGGDFVCYKIRMENNYLNLVINVLYIA